MTIISIIIFLVVAFFAYWIITHFFPEPIKTPALLVMGVILLIILIMQFFPEIGNFHVGR
jgi:Na+-driven multidrug efflux pump